MFVIRARSSIAFRVRARCVGKFAHYFNPTITVHAHTHILCACNDLQFLLLMLLLLLLHVYVIQSVYTRGGINTINTRAK